MQVFLLHLFALLQFKSALSKSTNQVSLPFEVHPQFGVKLREFALRQFVLAYCMLCEFNIQHSAILCR